MKRATLRTGIGLLTLIAAGANGCNGFNSIGGGNSAAAAKDEGTQVAEFANASSVQLNVQFRLGLRDSNTGGIVRSIRGESAYVKPAASYLYRVASASLPVSPYTPLKDRVVQFRVNVVTPSWEKPEAVWYEVVAPPPVKIEARGTAQNLTFRCDQGQVVLVPKEHWPDRGLE